MCHFLGPCKRWLKSALRPRCVKSVERTRARRFAAGQAGPVVGIVLACLANEFLAQFQCHRNSSLPWNLDATRVDPCNPSTLAARVARCSPPCRLPSLQHPDASHPQRMLGIIGLGSEIPELSRSLWHGSSEYANNMDEYQGASLNTELSSTAGLRGRVLDWVAGGVSWQE
jgi:hypothetical protein